MGRSRGRQGVGAPPEKSQNIGFLSKTGPDRLNNHKATKPAFNVGPSSASQRNPIYMAGFAGGSHDGTFLVVFGPVTLII